MGIRDKGIHYEDLSLFSRQLSLVAESDLSMQQGLSVIGGETGNSALKKISGQIMEDLNQGRSLHEAVGAHVKTLGVFFVEMVGVGEKSGNLPAMLKRTADAIDKKIETSQKIRSAVIYPVILSVLMLAVIVLILVFVLPIFEDIFMSMGGQMPGLTKGLMDFGAFVSKNILFIFAALALLIIVLYVLKKTGVGKPAADKIKFITPFVGGVVRARAATEIAMNLSMLLKSGINTTLAVEMLVPLTENGYIADKLEKAVRNMSEGMKPHQALDGLGIFPALIIKLLAVAGETGRMDTTLDRAAFIMGREAETGTENLIAFLEPVLIILLSLLVGFILVSVILPVTGIMNAIG